MINRKNKYIAISILAGSMMLSVGCSSSNDTDNNQETSQQSLRNNVDFMEDKNSIYGEIIDINEGNITLAVGEFNMKNRGEKPSGESSTDEKPNSERHEILEGEKHNKGEQPTNGEPMDIISLTGEEKIVAITNDIIINKMRIKRPSLEDEDNNTASHSNEQLTLAELSLGDIIKVNYNEDKTKIKSVELVSSPSKESNDEVAKG